MAQLTKLLALLACGIVLASLMSGTESTAVWDTIVPVDNGVWYQASFYEYPIPGLQGEHSLFLLALAVSDVGRDPISIAVSQCTFPGL